LGYIILRTAIKRCTWYVAARLGCKVAMVGTRWANSNLCCMNRLRIPHSHLVRDSFLAGKTTWGLSGHLPSENADYCILINELASLLHESSPGFSFWVRAQTEIKIPMMRISMLKVVSREQIRCAIRSPVVRFLLSFFMLNPTESCGCQWLPQQQ